ncbi:unnamed protein product [Parajaminaea phylloscopi]
MPSVSSAQKQKKRGHRGGTVAPLTAGNLWAVINGTATASTSPHRVTFADDDLSRAASLPAELVDIILLDLSRSSPANALVVSLLSRRHHRMSSLDQSGGFRHVARIGHDLNDITGSQRLDTGNHDSHSAARYLFAELDQYFAVQTRSPHLDFVRPGSGLQEGEAPALRENWPSHGSLVRSCPNLVALHLWRDGASTSNSGQWALPAICTTSWAQFKELSIAVPAHYEFQDALSILLTGSRCSKLHLYKPDLSSMLFSLPKTWFYLRLTEPVASHLLEEADTWSRLLLERVLTRVKGAYATVRSDDDATAPTATPQLIVIVSLTDSVPSCALRRMAIAVEKCWALMQVNPAYLDTLGSKELGQLRAGRRRWPDFRVIFIHPSLHNADNDDDGWTTFRSPTGSWDEEAGKWTRQKAFRQCVRSANGRPSWWSSSDLAQTQPEPFSDRTQNVLEWLA